MHVFFEVVKVVPKLTVILVFYIPLTSHLRQYAHVDFILSMLKSLFYLLQQLLLLFGQYGTSIDILDHLAEQLVALQACKDIILLVIHLPHFFADLIKLILTEGRYQGPLMPLHADL